MVTHQFSMEILDRWVNQVCIWINIIISKDCEVGRNVQLQSDKESMETKVLAK